MKVKRTSTINLSLLNSFAMYGTALDNLAILLQEKVDSENKEPSNLSATTVAKILAGATSASVSADDVENNDNSDDKHPSEFMHLEQ